MTAVDDGGGSYDAFVNDANSQVGVLATAVMSMLSEAVEQIAPESWDRKARFRCTGR